MQVYSGGTMGARGAWPRGRALLLLMATPCLVSCSNTGDLSISNVSGEAVTVDLGDEQVDVTADGGVVLLGYGCTPGDISVERPSGKTDDVAGPVCPDQQISIDADGVRLVPTN
ncbi:hypothetical protein [Pseudactinotalea sp.]|uniref:hypothetical protein n=1 Tax=Pseudactinotalea sp. TaxID=1926260 RepID=UPI003B3AE390